MAVHAENLQASPSALTPGAEVNGWRILGSLGEGGFGAAYRVEAVAQPGEFFVLELAREPGDERVERELVLLMNRAVHPHVVRLRDCGRWPHPATGHLYFVMDWVAGVPLHTWAETRNPTIRLVVEKLATVALTLKYLHAQGVMHRDIKPEHILIRESDGTPMLIGFGLGGDAGAERLAARAMGPGTPHLLSPEAVAFWREHGGTAHYAHKPTDDVYALGVTAYRVLTGHWPFSPQLPREELFSAIETLTPPRPWDVNPKLPMAVNEVVQAMMAKRVEARYPSCAQAYAMLMAAVNYSGPRASAVNLFGDEPVPGAPSPRSGRRRGQRQEWPTKARAERRTADAWLMGAAKPLFLVVLAALAALMVQRLPMLWRAKQSPHQKKPLPELKGPEVTGLECPQEAIANMRWLSIGTLHLRPLEHAAQSGPLLIDVRDGEKVIWAMLDPWASRVPVGTRFHGQLWVRDRLYGRFDRMVQPDGKQLPVCLEFWKSEFVPSASGQGMSSRLVAGIELAQPRSEQGVGQVDIQAIETEPVRRWGVLKPEEGAAP
jgi:serine/threonine-protein kinase